MTGSNALASARHCGCTDDLCAEGNLELLDPLFQPLGAKDCSILGHTFGVYGYEKLSADEMGLRKMLSPNSVTKAQKTALKHPRQRYPNSDLSHWRRGFQMMRQI